MVSRVWQNHDEIILYVLNLCVFFWLISCSSLWLWLSWVDKRNTSLNSYYQVNGPGNSSSYHQWCFDLVFWEYSGLALVIPKYSGLRTRRINNDYSCSIFKKLHSRDPLWSMTCSRGKHSGNDDIFISCLLWMSCLSVMQCLCHRHCMTDWHDIQSR